MFNKATLMWLYAEHPVHAGSGSGVGAIDMPIQRERVSNWPIIQPSSLKGSLREYFERLKLSRQSTDPQYKQKFIEVFGERDASHAGAVSPTEAKILFFPVRSLKGTFAYVTCPLAIRRFRRDLEAIRACGGEDFLSANGNQRPAFPSFSQNLPTNTQVMVQTQANAPQTLDSDLVISGQGSTRTIVFEELSFEGKANADLTILCQWLNKTTPALPWLDSTNTFARRLALVHDDVFKDFVEMSTEIIARNLIDDNTGTVEQGGLWAEEHLPRETVLYSTLFATSPLVSSTVRQLADVDKVLDFVRTGDGAAADQAKYLWIGGKTTVGRGLVRLQIL